MKRIVSLFILLSFNALGDDLYRNYTELQQHEVEGRDYRIRVIDSDLSLGIFAIHGGAIENGTSELAKAIAKDSMNQYFFEGIKKENNFSLHITSTHFDEPRAVRIAEKSKNCLSIHGYIGNEDMAICIGGGNIQQANRVAEILKLKLPDINIIYPCTAYPGVGPFNIVNRCLNQGVQLEFSQSLRDYFLKGPDQLEEAAVIIREAFYKAIFVESHRAL